LFSIPSRKAFYILNWTSSYAISFGSASEVIFDDEVRQLQVGSAERVLQVLYKPIKQRGNLFAEELGDSSFSPNVYSPSMIAALTVLYIDKNRRMVQN
jgi:lipid-A-disaccharide synthase